MRQSCFAVLAFLQQKYSQVARTVTTLASMHANVFKTTYPSADNCAKQLCKVIAKGDMLRLPELGHYIFPLLSHLFTDQTNYLFAAVSFPLTPKSI